MPARGVTRFCVDTAAYCLEMGGSHAAVEHIRLLLDCEQICRTTEDFMLRGSQQHASACTTCAEVCDACAASCEQFSGDAQMEACAKECRTCAETCRRAAAVPMPTHSTRGAGRSHSKAPKSP
ncbi:MAG: four-helix bundle copper-binding protein [Minicystis sp.]